MPAMQRVYDLIRVDHVRRRDQLGGLIRDYQLAV
jgi:hypothetical protein